MIRRVCGLVGSFVDVCVPVFVTWHLATRCTRSLGVQYVADVAGSRHCMSLAEVAAYECFL